MRTRALLLAALSLLGGCGGGTDGSAPEVSAHAHARPRGWENPADPYIQFVDTPTIPVLLLHQICPATCASSDTYGMSAADFDALLGKLDQLGYETISSADFAAFRRNRPVSLPHRPLYLTFDDGRKDAYVGATPVLVAHHARATMFVITADPGSNPFYMTWAEVLAASTSAEWDIELHARAGHTSISTSRFDTGHFFASRRWSEATVDPWETLEGWRDRTQGDIEGGEADLAAHLPGHVTHSFAVPFGDYGQSNREDPEIRTELSAYLDAHYEAWFTQLPDAPFARPAAGGQTFRYAVFNTTRVADIVAWLAKHQAS
jgi:peptidoglycan/xylan/chitin deacetylase (PgdA/CDA1 family)